MSETLKPVFATAQPSAIDKGLQQLFNQSLREQLHACMSDAEQPEHQSALKTAMAALTELLLHQPDADHQQLVQQFAQANAQLATSYAQAELTESENNSAFINATGLVMAVKDAIHTVNDIYRVKAFIRGIDQALASREANHPIHLLYPACGPFAPLLLPLISYYQQRDIGPQQLRITLIDLQPGAVKVLNQLVDDLDLRGYIHEIRCQDVMDYQPEQPIDVLVMEALQHGFTREGHLAFARHLSRFLSPDAIMIPEKISVTASLNEGQREYVDQWSDQERTHSSLMDPAIQAARTPLSEIFTLTLDSLRKLNVIPLGDSAELVECNQVRIPTGVSNINKQSLLLSVTATTFGQEQILEYDSGISHPLYDLSLCIDFVPQVPEPDDLLAKSGDKLKFYYKLTGTPGFLPTIA
ncbi:class I SAM-dependent methyltransferase [Marinobacterium arenosum]|uniref:class I SAM-dependent methyltransferase n=1 Tax=Marinobacterium arenosum TaxID=2862496 RepID=UPI001C9388F0|nr:class I SAM-dependent methyltransferase [Marinobacterium arenosum]MBY4678830.1 hypothetical protein [Marinobacterium arenosum]